MNINGMVISWVVRGVMFNRSTGAAMWMVNNIAEPSLQVTTETEDVVDAIGSRIMRLDRAKSMTFSANNSIFSFDLLAAQNGTEVARATSSKKIEMPEWETVTLTAEIIAAGTITLRKIPVGLAGAEIPFIYEMSGSGLLSKRFTPSENASGTAFKLEAATKTLTIPTGLTAGTRLWIPYTAENEDGQQLVANGVDFPKAGRYVQEVLLHDPCAPDVNYYAYQTFNNAKLNGDFDISFTTTGNHPFTIECMQDYCDPEKKLFTMDIPELVPEASAA